MMLFRNRAGQVVSFLLLTTNGTPVTSGTSTVQVKLDGGSQATGAGTKTHKGGGEWDYFPTQAETDGDHWSMVMTNDTTDCLPDHKQGMTQDYLAAYFLTRASRGYAVGIVGSGSTDTVINLASIELPGPDGAILTSIATNALRDQLVRFPGDTPETSALRLLSAQVASNTSGSTPAVTLTAALTTAPVAGDFVVFY